MRRRGRILAVLGVSWALVGCASTDKVVRVIDGRPVAGDFVPADAYAAYLRGSIADAAGDLAGAIEGYAIAASLGPNDPEPLARLGDARCRVDPHDPRAEQALSAALSLDSAYSPALEARARCAERQGDVKGAVASAKRAAKADPASVEPLATLARLQQPGPGASSEELRARLVAMTLVQGTNAAAWGALATWARGHGDTQLEVRALSQVVSLGPGSRGVTDAIVRFEGEGDAAAARSLARAYVEAGGGQAIDARIARLAIDSAILAADMTAARRIATRSHTPLVVLAARALLRGDDADALTVATTLHDAEPSAVAPRLVLASIAASTRDGAGVARALSGVPASASAVPPEVWLAFARTLARAGALDGARAFLRSVAREPLIPGDAVAVSLAVALAAGGALDARELDANGRVELAERRAEAAPDDALAGADPRHRLLALSRRAPHDPKTVELARTLAAKRREDPIVAVAFARLSLSGAVDVASTADAFSHLDPADPLVAAAALDCALRAGDARAIPLARARLAAVAHTPAERARVIE